MILERFPELAALSRNEQFQLGWELLDRMNSVAEPEEPLPPALHQALMKRYEQFRADPAGAQEMGAAIARMRESLAG